MKLLTEVWVKSKQLVLIFSRINLQKLITRLGALFICSLAPVMLRGQSDSEQTFELSPRVGAYLDSNEIEYFNIFPDFDFIRSAVYRKDNFGNIRFLLSKSDGKDTTITISRLAGEELGKLINQFEKVADNPKLVNWKLLPGFDPAKLNYFENTGRNISVNTTKGKYSGRLLHLSDSSVLIWQKKGDFSPDDCIRFIQRIHCSEIIALELSPGFSTKLFGASIGAGLAIAMIQLGFNLTASEDYLLSGNSLLFLGLGGLAGAVGGFFFDGLTVLARYKSIDQNYLQFQKVKLKIKQHGMFKEITPPEISNLKKQ